MIRSRAIAGMQKPPLKRTASGLAICRRLSMNDGVGIFTGVHRHCGLLEERRKMFRDRGIRGVGQSDFTKTSGAGALRYFVGRRSVAGSRW